MVYGILSGSLLFVNADLIGRFKQAICGEPASSGSAEHL